MSTSVITRNYKLRIIEYFVRGTELPRITKLCWGNGGHNGANAKNTNDGVTDLFSKVGEHSNITVSSENNNAILVTGKITAAQAGNVISEIGLLNSSGQLLCHKTFPPKNTAPGEEYSIAIRIIV